MPWPETTIPKFGEWDGNEDLSYSIVFDKVRADKEKFLPAVKNDFKDSSRNQKRDNAPGLVAGKGGPQTSIDRIIETGSRTSQNSSPKLSSKYSHRSAFDQKTFSNSRGNHSDTSERGQQPSHLLPTKDSMAQEMVICANGSHFHAHHDGLHGRVERVPGPMRQMHQYPAATKITRSQGCSETSSIADLPEKVIVPKFGEWDVGDGKAGEGFTVIFDRVRDEKKSTKSANKPPARIISPLRPTEDLYKGSQVHKKKGGWFLCCVDISE